MKRLRAHSFLLAVGLILSACGGQIVSETFEHVGTERSEPTPAATSEPTPAATSEPTPAATSGPAAAAVNLAFVQSTFTEACVDPVVVDDLFCDQVDIDGMAINGTSLYVPTSLEAEGMRDRAIDICQQISNGITEALFGVESIVVLDHNGDEQTNCIVRE